MLSGGLAGLGPRVFLTAGSVGPGDWGSFVSFLDGGDNGWVLVFVVDLVGVERRGFLVGVIVGLLHGIHSLEISYSEGYIILLSFIFPFCLHAITFNLLKLALIGRSRRS